MKTIENKERKSWFRPIEAIILIPAPIVLLILPANFFDHGQSISLFELVGMEDYLSKGITRGVMHLIHFEFQTAWEYNKLSFIVAPMLGMYWLKVVFRQFNIPIFKWF